MNAAEHDVAGISFSSLKRELEGIAAKIGELDDLVALVVVTEDNDILAQTRFGSGDTVVQGVIRNEQVGVKVATHSRLDFWRAYGGGRLGTDEGAPARNGNEVAHGWCNSYLEVVFLRSLKPLSNSIFSHTSRLSTYPPMKTIVREGGTKPGSLMRWPSSFSLTTERI